MAVGWIFAAAVCLCATTVLAHDKRMHPLPLRPGPLDDHPSEHEDQWAVIVSTSRFWHNYRHFTNALDIYRMARDSGIPDSHIVLMLADDVACEPRNRFPTAVHTHDDLTQNVMCGDVEVDYAGDSVTAINFLRVLTGRVPEGTSDRKQIFPGPKSNVLVYLTGHSYEFFMKFHDYDFMTSYDVAFAFDQMHASERYQRVLFIVDTCQAESLFTHITAPNVVSVMSSLDHENSLSHMRHNSVGARSSLVDGYTGELFKHFWRSYNGQLATPIAPSTPTYDGFDAYTPGRLSSEADGLLEVFGQVKPADVASHPVWNYEPARFPLQAEVLRRHWKVTDFFGVGLQLDDDRSSSTTTVDGWVELS